MNPTFFGSKNTCLLRTALLAATLLMIICSPVAGQGVNFEVVTGTQKYDDAKCVIQTLDSGYVVVGSTSAFGNGQSDIYLTKISKAGQVSWQQALGGAGVDKGNAVIQTPDSGFAITGYSNSSGNAGYDVYLVKTDKYGSPEWSNTYGGFDWDFGNSLLRTSKGGYVICGSTYSYGKGNGDIYLLETDSVGTLQWDSAYGGTAEDVANSVCNTNDGGYFMAGYTKSSGQGNEDVYLLKSDSTGLLKWERTYGGTGEDKAYECKLTSDGRNIVICSAKSFSPGGKYENWLMKINSLGDTLWTRRDSNTYNRVSTTVSQTADGGYIMGGHEDVNGNHDLYLHKVDAGGYYQNINTYGGAKPENAFSVKQTFDGGYVLVGTSESYGLGSPNIYVVKTGPALTTGTSVVVVVGTEENQLIHKQISFYPNPASDHINVNAEKISALEIFDVFGKLILTVQTLKGANIIETSLLPDGVYFIRMTNKDQIASGKIIIRH